MVKWGRKLSMVLAVAWAVCPVCPAWADIIGGSSDIDDLCLKFYFADVELCYAQECPAKNGSCCTDIALRSCVQQQYADYELCRSNNGFSPDIGLLWLHDADDCPTVAHPGDLGSTPMKVCWEQPFGTSSLPPSSVTEVRFYAVTDADFVASWSVSQSITDVDMTFVGYGVPDPLPESVSSIAPPTQCYGWAVTVPATLAVGETYRIVAQILDPAAAPDGIDWATRLLYVSPVLPALSPGALALAVGVLAGLGAVLARRRA